jgi:hypothetical protein
MSLNKVMKSSIVVSSRQSHKSSSRQSRKTSSRKSSCKKKRVVKS